MVSREQHQLHSKANAKCLDGRESSSHTGLQGFTKHLTPSGVRPASLELGPESPGCTHCPPAGPASYPQPTWACGFCVGLARLCKVAAFLHTSWTSPKEFSNSSLTSKFQDCSIQLFYIREEISALLVHFLSNEKGDNGGRAPESVGQAAPWHFHGGFGDYRSRENDLTELLVFLVITP